MASLPVVGTWVDKLGRGRVFLLAVALHLLAAGLSVPSSFEFDDEPLIWWASGVSVGLILAANKSATRLVVFVGGMVGHGLYLGWVAESDYVSAMGVHVLDVGIVSAAVLFTGGVLKARIPQSVGLYRILTSTIICIVAPAASYLLSETDASPSFWMMSRGLGLLAVGSALNIGRARWLEMTHPREHRREFAFALGCVVLATSLVAVAHTAFFWLAIGLCLFLAARFGLRVAAPGSLALAITFNWIADLRLGKVQNEVLESFNLIGTAWVLIVFSTLIGWLAGQVDARIVAQQAASQRWKKLAHRGFDAFVEFDRHHQVSDVSDSVQNLPEFRKGSFGAIDPLQVIDVDSYSQILGALDRVRGGENVRFERQFKLRHGLEFRALCLIEPRTNPVTNSYDGCTLYMLDATESARTNRGRTASRAALEKAQQAERDRVARVLHDGALQDLAAANLLIGAAQMPDAGSEVRDLSRIEALLTSGMQKLRNDAIASGSLDVVGDGVVAALTQTVEKFENFNSAFAQIRTDQLDDASPEASAAIFHITREAIINGMLHSRAESIDVEIRRDGEGFHVAVIDDGIGFNPDLLQEAGHLGLAGMSTAAHNAGGWFLLSTRPEHGTTVEAWVPDPTPLDARSIDDEPTASDDDLDLRDVAFETDPSSSEPARSEQVLRRVDAEFPA